MSTEDLNWDQVEELGTEKAGVIARRYGVSVQAVYRARQRRGLSDRFRVSPIDWSKVEDLDTAPTAVLMQRFGCSSNAVQTARRRKGIKVGANHNISSYAELGEFRTRLHDLEERSIQVDQEMAKRDQRIQELEDLLVELYNGSK